MLKERIERRDEEQQCAEALLQKETERRKEQHALDEGYQAAIMVQNTYTWRQTKMGENPFIAPWSTEAMLKERIERRDEEQQCAEALLQEETERRKEQHAMDDRYQTAIMVQSTIRQSNS